MSEIKSSYEQGPGSGRRIDKMYVEQLREELKNTKVPEQYKSEKQLLANKIEKLRVEFEKRATMDAAKKAQIKRELEESGKLLNRLKRFSVEAIESVAERIGPIGKFIKPAGRIASKAAPALGAAASIAGAGLAGYEAGKMIDELSDGYITDYWSKKMQPITDKIYGE